MALNPVVCSEDVVRVFLRYQLIAYLFAAARALADAEPAVAGRDSTVQAGETELCRASGAGMRGCGTSI